jgi:hypothetical protein
MKIIEFLTAIDCLERSSRESFCKLYDRKKEAYLFISYRLIKEERESFK